MSHTPRLLRVREQSEWDKALKNVMLEDNNGVFVLVADEKYGDRIAALWNMAERLGLSTEDIESGNVETKLKAAPDMLDALETIMDIGDKACRDIARAAIKKARGEE